MENKEGLWIKENGANFKIGLTKETKEDLGDISYVSLPKVGQTYKEGEPLLEVEAEKAVSEFKSPVSGTVIEVNTASEDQPELLNDPDPEKSFIAIIEG